MKELIVSLLVFVSTGMVFGQQSNNNGFTAPRGMRNAPVTREKSDPPLVPIEGTLRSPSSESRFGASNPGTDTGSSNRGFNSPTNASADRFGSNRSVLDSEASNDRRGFSSSSKPDFSSSIKTANRDTAVPYYLPIGDQQLALLEQRGVISAYPLDPRTGALIPIERIVFSDKGEPEDNKPTRSIQATDFNNGRITFALDDQQIRGLRDKTLYFDIPRANAGDIKEIAVQYANYRPRNNSQNAQQDTLDRRQFGNRADLTWNNQARNDRDNTANNGNIRDRWNLPNEGNQIGIDRNPIETQADRDKRLAWEKNQRDLESKKRWLEEKEYELKLREFRQQQERDRINAMQIAANQTPLNQAQFNPTQLQPVLPNQVRPDRLAYNGNGIIPGLSVTTNPGQNNTGDSKAVEALAEQLKLANERAAQADARVARLANENQYLYQQRNSQTAFTQAKAEISDQVRDRFNNNLPKPDYYGDSLARKEPQPSGRAVLNTGGNSGGTDMYQRKKIALEDKTVDDENRQGKGQLMMLILLLLSFALNLYLWWLAQSFYSRYQELADELRETFTATA